MRVSRAPGRLDVMGGIADYTGSLVCEMHARPRRRRRAAGARTTARCRSSRSTCSTSTSRSRSACRSTRSRDATRRRAAHASSTSRAASGRGTSRVPVRAARAGADRPARSDASTGMNLALLSTVPLGAGVSSSARDRSRDDDEPRRALRPPRRRLDADATSRRCASRSRTASSAHRAASWTRSRAAPARAGSLLRMVCQPHELQPPLQLPAGHPRRSASTAT